MTGNGKSPLYKRLMISDVREEAKGVKIFTFTGEDAQSISYKAGQYLTLVKFEHGQELRRSYSITSSPLHNEPLAICVKRVENGIFSRELVDHAKPGDELLTTGAGGFFTLPDDLSQVKQLFFFAAGSGIAPVFSLIKAALRSSDVKVVLVYSNNNPSAVIYYSELQQMEKEFAGRFHVEYLFSNSMQLEKARLHQMLLKSFLRDLAIAPFRDILFYTCGPFSYMRMVVFTLTEEHVPVQNIRKENFITEKPRYIPEPPDKELHTVIIRSENRELSIPVQYPLTILQAARKQGLTLPYSCEVGRCGNCVAKCKEGKVWMWNNEVLTDREVSGGLVLTCVGYPVDGNVTLEI
jgi:ferredoxin-NADP reductase